MQEYQQRVVQEKAELDDKLSRLIAFTGSESALFESLPLEEKRRLIRQRDLMQEYSSVLGQRIAAFPK